MSTLATRCKRHPILTAVLAWVLVMTPVGMVAEAGFHLEYEPGVEHSEGLRFLPAIEGMRTQPAPSYEPLRASGGVSEPSVTIVEPKGDFWRALANCESPTGRNSSNGTFIGYFQFHRGTARQVGISGGESYEEQRAAAQRWASRVNPGTTAGWPVCWHRAKAAVGWAPG